MPGSSDVPSHVPAYSDDEAAALYDVLNPWGPSDDFYLALRLRWPTSVAGQERCCTAFGRSDMGAGCAASIQTGRDWDGRGAAPTSSG